MRKNKEVRKKNLKEEDEKKLSLDAKYERETYKLQKKWRRSKTLLIK